MSSSVTDTDGTAAVFLSSFSDLWVYFTLWTMGGVGVAFFVAGVIACRVDSAAYKWTWVPPAMLVFGVVIGFLDGAIPATLIAAVYTSIPYAIGIDVAAGIGIGQAMIITYFQLGRADFIHR